METTTQKTYVSPRLAYHGLARLRTRGAGSQTLEPSSGKIANAKDGTGSTNAGPGTLNPAETSGSTLP